MTLAAMLATPNPAVAATAGSGSLRPDPAHARHSGVIRLPGSDTKADTGQKAAADVVACEWYIESPFANPDKTIQTFVQVECDNIVDRIDIVVVMYEDYVSRTINGASQDAVSAFLLPSIPIPCNDGSGYFGGAYVEVENDGYIVSDSGYSVLNVFFC